jgi:hypothetical protein
VPETQKPGVIVPSVRSTRGCATKRDAAGQFVFSGAHECA